MKITDVIIKNFRSIEHAQLDNCGNINVLIGKNNAGKSNILLAIATFFEFVSQPSIYTITNETERVNNSFRHQQASIIDITLIFSFTSPEVNLLKQYGLFGAFLGDEETKLRITLSSAVIQEGDTDFYYSIISQVMIFNSQDNLSILEFTNPSIDEAISAIINYEHFKSAQELLIQLLQNDKLKLQKDNTEIIKRALNNAINQNKNHEELLQDIIKGSSSYPEFINTIDSGLNSTEGSIEDLNTLLRTLTGLNYEGLADIKNNIDTIVQVLSNNFMNQKERRFDLGLDEAKMVLELSRRKDKRPTILRFQEKVKAVLGIPVEAFVDHKENPILEADDFLVQMNGYGVKEALRIIFDYETKRPKVLLIEEPELHLHPSLEINLMRYLKEISADCQIFMTTHSTNFIDTGDVKNVYLVSKHESTTVQPLNTEEAASLIPQELGLRLSSLFMYNKLVFVEGKLDEDILRAWATTLGINLSQHNIGFVHMGGITKYFYFAVEETLNFLSQKQVEVWFIADRDERGDDEIAALGAKLNGKATLYILNKREIENYLFAPRAIAHFLRDKGRASGLQSTTDGITTEAIQQQLTTCVEGCKQKVIEKHIAAKLPKLRIERDELFPKKPGPHDFATRSMQELERLATLISDAKSQFPSIAQEEAAAIEARWPTEKMNLVLGDELLNAVFQVYELRFLKSRDAAALAALMTEEEIDSEIKAFFKAITQ